jgi:hypothetical protein
LYIFYNDFRENWSEKTDAGRSYRIKEGKQGKRRAGYQDFKESVN